MDQKEYEMEYRCANCGHVFTVKIKKGKAAKGASGPCPNCGVANGKPGIGEHQMTWPTTRFAVGNTEILHG